MDSPKFVQDIINSSFSDSYAPSHQLGPDYVIPTEHERVCKVDLPVMLDKQIGDSSIPSESVVTFLQSAAKKFPNNYALITTRNGNPEKWTFPQYVEDIRIAAKGLIKLGLERFHGVGLLGFNAPEWFISHFASIFAGGLPVGIYTTNSPSSCLHILKDTLANIVIVENEVQLDKILAIINELPFLKAIIQYSGKPKQPNIFSWNDLMMIGRSVPDHNLDRRIRSLAINQCCTVVYTSATTGQAKGVMLNHDNLLYSAKFFCKYTTVVPKGAILSYLPLSHVAALVCDLYATVITGVTCHFRNADVLKGKLVDYLNEVRPATFLGVPRVFEKICEKLREAEVEMNPIKRGLLGWARKNAIGHNIKLNLKDNQHSSTPFNYTLSRNLVLKKIKKRLGLNKSLYFIAGGAPMNLDVLNYFLSLDIIITDCFGMSETAGPAITNTVKQFRFGTVGKLSPGEVKFHNLNEKNEGELLVRGRNVFMGYLNLENETQEVFLPGGWLLTGDIARQDKDGYVSITGRFKELIITGGGENVPPLYIENSIKHLLPIVSNCMVVGDKRKYLTLLITLRTEINTDTMEPTDELTAAAKNWCRDLGSSAQSVSDVLKGTDEVVAKEVQLKIEEYNMEYSISNAQKIQKWIILPKDFSLAGGELGPSLKLKRQVVLDKYKTIIEDMYT